MNIKESNAIYIYIYIYQASANEAIVTTYHTTPQTRGYVTHDKYITKLTDCLVPRRLSSEKQWARKEGRERSLLVARASRSSRERPEEAYQRIFVFVFLCYMYCNDR